MERAEQLVGKGASLGVGLLALALTKEQEEARCDGVTLQGSGPMRIPWNQPSFVAMLGGGLIGDEPSTLADADTSIATATIRARVRFLGFSAMYSRLMEGNEWLEETDLGPTFYFANHIVTFGIQPSVLISRGNGVKTMFGKGMRTWTRANLGYWVVMLDTMLGTINDQWNYHARVGAALRLLPRLFVMVAFDYRDILDLNDLGISQSSLGGAVVGIGGRYN